MKRTAQGLCPSNIGIFFQETWGLPSVSAKPCLKCLNCLLSLFNSGTIGVVPSTRFPAEVLSAFSSLWPTWECRASLVSGKCPTQERVQPAKRANIYCLFSNKAKSSVYPSRVWFEGFWGLESWLCSMWDLLKKKMERFFIINFLETPC